jgi:hypothetical protein
VFEWSFLTAEEVGTKCLAIARELIENNFDFQKVDVSEPGKAEIVGNLKEGGIAQFGEEFR